MKSGSARWKSVSKCRKNTTDKNLNVKVNENSEFEKHGNVEEKSDNFDKRGQFIYKSTIVKVNLNILHPGLDKLTKKIVGFLRKFFLDDLLFQNLQSMKYSIGRYPSNKVLYIVFGKLKWLLERKDQNKLIEV